MVLYSDEGDGFIGLRNCTRNIVVVKTIHYYYYYILLSNIYIYLTGG